MQKITKLFIGIAALLFIATWTMTWLFIRANSNYHDTATIAKECIVSFVNSVNYTLCEEDVALGNVTSTTCSNYQSQLIDDIKLVRNLGYTFDYNYSGVTR